VFNLRQVECFVCAVEQGTITAAADQLLVSQSAVSLAIAGLEKAIGTQLLVRRRSRGLALTAAGRHFVPRAKELLALAADVRAEVQSQARDLTGELVVGCYRTIAPFVLPGLIETFAAQHPQVRLAFIEGTLPEVEQALRDGRCEVAIVYDLDVGPGIECEALYQTEPYVVLAPEHPLASRGDRLELRNLADHELVMLCVPPSKAYFTGIFASAGVVPRVRFNVSNYELLRSLVGRNLGYGLLISRPCGDFSYEGRPLEARRLAGPTFSIDVSLAWATGVRRTRRASAFGEHCQLMLPQQLGAGAGAVLTAT
jgi:DNA-binding transcriptional LysR family regulator